MIKVAMIADHPGLDTPNDGGVQAVTSYLVHAMSQFQDVELHVLRLKLGIDRVCETKGPNFVLHSVPIARLGTITGFLQDQRTVNRCLAAIQPDVVHSQGGGHHGILASRTIYPSVVTIHGILTQEVSFQRGFQRQMRTRIQGWIADHYCIRRASNTILISPYVAEYYGTTLAGKRYLIPNPVDERFFDVVRRESPGRILFAGRLNARKGVTDLLNAISRLESVGKLQLILAGSTSDTEYVKQLTTLASQLKLTDVVDFRGTLKTDDMLHELSECACLVLPSYQETAPMVIQEAMASGVPIIASDICGIPYQVDDDKTGFLFPPGDVDTLAHKLSILLSDKSIRRRFGDEARRKAYVEYRASAVARKTLDVYKEMLR